MTVTVSAPDGTTVDFPDGTDAATIHGAMMQHFGGDEPAPTASPSVAKDVATQAGVGLVSGAVNLPTAVPRLLGAAGKALEPSIESAVGYFSPAKAADMHQAAADREAAFQGLDPDKPLNDMLPAPQTTAGKYARTAGEFVPSMMAAPGSFVRNALVGTGAGLTSEGAGQATEGSAAEPYARAGAGLLAGVIGAAGAARAAPALAPQALIDEGAAAYRSPEVTAVQIRPAAAQRVSDDIIANLNRSRLNARLAPQTHAILEDLPTPVNGPNHSLEDFQTVRTLLGRQAGNFSNPTEQAAASQAIPLLDNHVASMPQSDLLAGDIGAANTTLTAGRGDYAAGMAANRVQTKLDNAELQAASAHSGGNIDNATRQKLRTILTSPAQSRGLTPEELDQIDQVVRGSPTGNVLRATGKVLGGGGGLGALVTAAEGAHVAGPIGAAAPIAGYGIKRLGDALTARAANQAVQQILSRAPSAQALRGAAPANLSPVTGGLVGALMGGTHQSQPPLLSLPLALSQSQQQ